MLLNFANVNDNIGIVKRPRDIGLDTRYIYSPLKNKCKFVVNGSIHTKYDRCPKGHLIFFVEKLGKGNGLMGVS